MATGTVWLDNCLAPLAPYLAREDVSDIWINRPGEVWIETLGGSVARYAAAELNEALLARLARQVAAATAQGISREHPILSASLPTGERVQIVIPPATRRSIAIAIRKHGAAGLALEDYEADGAFTTANIAYHEGKARELPGTETSKPMAFLRKAVIERRNILISGGTSSGKTTFLNALLREVPRGERLILIEDTPELRLEHENAIGLLARRSALGEAAVTAEDLLIASLRMRPDRIILGEIRGAEAGTFLRAVNTGHPGSISTIHADSPTRAIDQLALLVIQTGIRMAWEDVVTYVRTSLDVIVQLQRNKGIRQVGEILMVNG